MTEKVITGLKSIKDRILGHSNPREGLSGQNDEPDEIREEIDTLEVLPSTTREEFKENENLDNRVISDIRPELETL